MQHCMHSLLTGMFGLGTTCTEGSPTRCALAVAKSALLCSSVPRRGARVHRTVRACWRPRPMFTA